MNSYNFIVSFSICPNGIERKTEPIKLSEQLNFTFQVVPINIE